MSSFPSDFMEGNGVRGDARIKLCELLSRLEAAVCSRKAWKRWEVAIQVTVCGCRGVNDELQLRITSAYKLTRGCRFLFFFLT